MGLHVNEMQIDPKSVQLPSWADFEDCHEKIREMIAYWHAIHPAEGLPGRQHFDPIDIPRLLPNLRMVDVEGRPPRFKTRLMGTVLLDFFGEEHTGHYFDDLYPKFKQSKTYQDLYDVVANRRPNWRRGEPGLVYEKDFVTVERVYLPLAEDGSTVDMIVTCILFGDQDGNFR